MGLVNIPMEMIACDELSSDDIEENAKNLRKIDEKSERDENR